MTEEEYKNLCKYCDSILLAEDITVEQSAVSFLHILREHPVFLSSYEHFFRSENRTKFFSVMYVNSLKNKIALGYRLLKSIVYFNTSWLETAINLPLRADILFVSHLLNESRIGEDIYFGDLPKKLAQEGYSVVIAYINHTGISGKKLLENIDSKDVGIAVIPETLSFWGELRLYCRLKKSSLNWKKKLKEQKTGLYKNILKYAISDLDSHSTAKNLKIGHQVANISESLNAKAVIVTYEGHAWERVVFQEIHSKPSKILCLGYIHAAVFRLQHSILRNMPRPYEPDMLLTGGSVAKKQLENKMSLRHLPILVLGSSRTLIQNKIGKAFPEYENNKNICLIIPEGIWEEYDTLLNFSIKCAHLCPRINFVIRRHPLMQGKSRKIDQAKLDSAPSNFAVSTKPLNEDIQASKWAIYRGSTAIIQSVIGGLVPIYIELAGEMIIDPLYEVAGNRASLATPWDFKLFTESKDWYDEKRKSILIKYCLDFYEPFKPRVLKEIIDKHHE